MTQVEITVNIIMFGWGHSNIWALSLKAEPPSIMNSVLYIATIVTKLY